LGVIPLLASCGELPKPFAQSSIKKNYPLITYSGGGAIKVEVDSALPASLSKPLIENMVESLWKENIPASTSIDFNPRYLLKGELKILNSSLFEAEKVELIWKLSERNKSQNYEFTYPLSGESPGWLLLDKNPLKFLSQEMGRDVARRLYKEQGLEELELSLIPNIEGPVSRNQLNLSRKLNMSLPKRTNDSLFMAKKHRIFFDKVVGAPGDGNNSLQKYLRRNLIIAGLDVVKDRNGSMFLLNGFVNVSPTYDALNDIAITWLVTTKEGKIVGKTTQNNKISKGVVDREWGQVAKDAAREGSIGVMNVITRYLTSGANDD